MLRIGLIVWFVIIWIIDCSINPFFIWVTIAMAVFLVFCSIHSWWCENHSEEFQSESDPITKLEREKAIDEWEKKWGRKHPTRK